MMKTFCVLFCLVALLVALAAARDVAVYSSFEEHAQASQDYFNQRTAQLKAAGGVGSSVAGVDFSTSLSVSTLKCIANEGFEGFAIPRGYCSYGGVDSHMVTNVANAHSAGFKAVDVYFFPCVTCSKNAAQQFDELWTTFTNQKVNVGMVWFDAESASTTGTRAQNQAFIQAWLARAAHYGAKVGIYSSRYMWGVCYGDNFRLPSTSYPTWYALYNNNGSNCSDYASYTWGGFPKANIKQWAGDKTLCGAGIDKNILC